MFSLASSTTSTCSLEEEQDEELGKLRKVLLIYIIAVGCIMASDAEFALEKENDSYICDPTTASRPVTTASDDEDAVLSSF